MKLFIASDIHGSVFWCERMTEAVRAEAPELVLLLGDILYHGPRNDLPAGYDPKKVADLLAPLADRLLCVRGNCDSEVDQMVLAFPILSENAALVLDGHLLVAVHGHHMREEKATPTCGEAVLFGHTHVPGVFPAPQGDRGELRVPRQDIRRGAGKGSVDGAGEEDDGSVSVVTAKGEIFLVGFSCGHEPNPAVRPAMWIALGGN